MDRLMNTINVANPNSITLYHGTDKDNFIPDPYYDNPKNDYGSGLYTTRDLNKAKQWAMSKYNSSNHGYAYEYVLDTSDLNVLDLCKEDSLSWISILIKNRGIGDKTEDNPLLFNRIKMLQSKYDIDTSKYDIIIGYRADDSFYKYASDFVSGSIYKEVLDQALMLGKLGKQYCLKTKKAFDNLKYVGKYNATQKDRDEFNRIDREAALQYLDIKRLITCGRTISKFIDE